MKSKKFVLAGLVLLAIVMVLVGCDTNAGTVQHEHTGGTATCISKAKCSECGAEYGEYNGNNHEQEEVESVEIDGTLGGKTEATEEEVNALVEQLKAYVDNGLNTIIVTGETPAMYNLLGSDLPAVSAAIFFLGSSGSTTNGDRNSPYCGTIDLIMPDATSLAYMEFCSTYALNSVTLPKVTKLADQAFHDTPYLRTITFGSVLTEVNVTGGVMFGGVGQEVGGCDLILNCGQMNETNVPTPDLTTNTWKFKFENEFKSITLTHTGEKWR